ncbi:hypothetical protein BD779DRAFT_1679265 [Infundibulicybe gibba]|nr:hypothetical protein BD779DRAFT_1679265 [Infundibulicybe gibba]
MPCPNCSCHSCRSYRLTDPPISSSDKPPLPLFDLTTTNPAPIDLEVVDSRDIIRSAEKTVPLIQVMIDGLERWKAELLSAAKKHKAVISPLGSLPPELLAKIFAAFVTTTERYSTPRTPNPSPLLVLMGTRIIGAPPMFDSWIDRSKGLPLHLELDLDSPDSYPILEALVPHADRWEYINFSHIGLNSLSVLACARNNLHSLKRLNLDFADAAFGIVDFCEVAPQLTDVRLTGIYESIIVKLPWEQLRTCTLDNSGATHYILQHAKNLRTCHLNMARLEVYDTWSSPRNSHSCNMGLDTLVVRWHMVDPDLDIFFSSITLPSLQNLEVDFDSCSADFKPDCDDCSDSDSAIGDNQSDSNSDIDDDQSDSDSDSDDDRSELLPMAMSRFFERSSAHLSVLTLLCIPFPPSRLIKWLAHVPSLISLDIRFEFLSINNKLLHALNASLPGHILPCLRSLSLRWQGRFSEELLDTVIASRRDIDPADDRVALLESLTLACSVPRGQPTNRLPRFHRFVSGGLNITYENGWDVYNSIRTDSSKSLPGGRV